MTNKIEKKQHYQFPTDIENSDLKPEDKTISPEAAGLYVYLKTWKDKDQDYAFPSITTIKKKIDETNKSPISREKIEKLINELEERGYVTIERGNAFKSKSNKYTFNKYKKFEMIKPEILFNKKYTLEWKGAYILHQKRTFIDNNDNRVMHYDSIESHKLLGWSDYKLKKWRNQLMEDGALQIDILSQRDHTGFPIE